jgi:hypothetical protein
LNADGPTMPDGLDVFDTPDHTHTAGSFQFHDHLSSPPFKSPEEHIYIKTTTNSDPRGICFACERAHVMSSIDERER